MCASLSLENSAFSTCATRELLYLVSIDEWDFKIFDAEYTDDVVWLYSQE